MSLRYDYFHLEYHPHNTYTEIKENSIAKTLRTDCSNKTYEFMELMVAQL